MATQVERAHSLEGILEKLGGNAAKVAFAVLPGGTTWLGGAVPSSDRYAEHTEVVND